MSLDENKAGAAAVDPSDFNTVVDAVVDLQAGGGGGGGLPTGWTQDGSDPSTLSSNGGGLDLGTGVATLQNILLFHSGITQKIGNGTADPSSAGYAASLGSLYLRDNGQAWIKTGAGDTDWTRLTTGAAQAAYVGAVDPGAVGAGAIWMDTSGEAIVFRQRDLTDVAWTDPVTFVGVEVLTGGVVVSEAFHFPPFSGGFTIEPDGSKINVDTPLDMQGTGILASGDIDLDGDDLQNVGGFTLSSPPELPAVPTPQDIADALIAAFGFTQAAP